MAFYVKDSLMLSAYKYPTLLFNFILGLCGYTLLNYPHSLLPPNSLFDPFPLPENVPSALYWGKM